MRTVQEYVAKDGPPHLPGAVTLICDGFDCGTTPHQGDSAVLLRKMARELSWVRVDGKDYCPMCNPERASVVPEIGP